MVTIKKSKHSAQLYGVEYKHIRSLRIIYLCMAGLLFALLSFMVVFVYNNVFRALEEANVIVVLQSELQMKTINLNRLEEVEQAWSQKTEKSDLSGIKNPFYSLQDVTQSPTSEIPTPIEETTDQQEPNNLVSPNSSGL